MIVDIVRIALEKMDRKYCTLSQIDYGKIPMRDSGVSILKEAKYLERPFAYELYHQLRDLIKSHKEDFGGSIIQAEVDKKYQHCFENGKIPDFILHLPNSKKNLAIIEVKLATNFSKIEKDFQKLVDFKKDIDLKYQHGIEIIIGDTNSLLKAKTCIIRFNKKGGQIVEIIEFNTTSWKASEYTIQYDY